MAQPVKFYLDEHVGRAILRGLRQRGVDVLSVAEAGLMSASDEEQLAKALDDSRVIFTQDEDYLRLHHAGVEHAGIAFAPQGVRIGTIIHGLMLIHQVLNAEEMKGHVEYL